MNAIFDLGSELLVDQSTLRDPYLRLLAAAIGQRMTPGSPWLAINKSAARVAGFPIKADFERPIHTGLESDCQERVQKAVLENVHASSNPRHGRFCLVKI